jgi:hypothetical protein
VVGALQARYALGRHGPDPQVGAGGRDGLLAAHRLPEHAILPG